MKYRTLYFAPARVTPGMSLARTINDREGHVLLVAGTVLDAEMLDRLVRRGVESVAVLVPDLRDAETIAHELRSVEARVDTIFRGDGSPARAALQAAILAFRQEQVR